MATTAQQDRVHRKEILAHLVSKCNEKAAANKDVLLAEFSKRFGCSQTTAKEYVEELKAEGRLAEETDGELWVVNQN